MKTNKFITVRKAINGISINGSEYLLNDKNEAILFNDKNEAVFFLECNGLTRSQIETLNFVEVESENKTENYMYLKGYLESLKHSDLLELMKEHSYESGYQDYNSDRLIEVLNNIVL